MIIKIDSGSRGWSNYVVNGTSSKPRDHSKIELIDGDLALGDMICDNTSYETSYYRFVLAFKGKPLEEKMQIAYDEWKELFFHGFNEDEYHCDCVLHKDTDDYHYHIRVPKVNLLTNTQLILYHHKSDLKRKDLIQQYIDLKNDLESPHDNKALIHEQSEFFINDWREQHGQELLDFSKKAKRTKAITAIQSYIVDAHKDGVIDHYRDIKYVMKELQLDVVKEGFDKGKNFYYITVENNTGKVRLTGELFDPDGSFWKSSKTKQAIQLKTNRLQKQKVDKERKLALIKEQLDKENEKRMQFIEQRYSSARKRAKQSELIINEEQGKEPVEKEIEDERVRSINNVITRVREKRKEQQRIIRTVEASGKRAYQKVRSDLKRDSRLLKDRGCNRSRWKRYSIAIGQVADQLKRGIEQVKRLLRIKRIKRFKNHTLDDVQLERD